MSKREANRLRAQLRRKIAKSVALQKKNARRNKVTATLDMLKTIVSDGEFTALASALGIDTLPQRLRDGRQSEVVGNNDSEFANPMMDFVVAWKFMHPLLENDEMREFLHGRWPNFAQDFQDVFISLVMDGPFPDERRTAMRATMFRL